MLSHPDFTAGLSLFRGQGPIRLQRADLEAFLDLTAAVPAPPYERLRQLAIDLECLRFADGWSGLQSIYAFAEELAPEEMTVFHSWGIAAVAWMDSWMTPDLAQRVNVAAEGERAFRKALELSPRDSRIAHSLGLLYYNHPLQGDEKPGLLTEAISCFRKAVEWDSANDISRLYLAHCFHDLEDWPAAIEQYQAVDLERLASRWPKWRAWKCREQLGHCQAMSGQTQKAIQIFMQWLAEVEAMDENSLEENIINIQELLEAVEQRELGESLTERARALSARLGSTR